MANCGDLEDGLRNMRRRMDDIERRLGSSSGGSGGAAGNNNFDEEVLIRKVIERVFKDPRWQAAVDCLKVIIRGNP